MVSKFDRTVDSSILLKKGATVATSRLSIFHGFSLIDFSGEVAEFVQNLKDFPTKSTVDYVADPRSCNSRFMTKSRLST
jgi:hypothetical protein